MTDQSTLSDLAAMLTSMSGRSIKLSARGGIYVATVRYPGGTAQFANDTLSGAINGAAALVQTPIDAPEAPEVTPDPTGTRVVAVVPPPDEEEPL
jgi:hypothetical protein